MITKLQATAGGQTFEITVDTKLPSITIEKGNVTCTTIAEVLAYLSGFDRGVTKEAARLKNEVKLKANKAHTNHDEWPEGVLSVLEGLGLYDTDSPARA